MRVLFVTYPEDSNVKGMVSLAWALGAAGHDVLVAGHPESVEFVRRAGLTAVSLGRDHVMWSYMKRRSHLAQQDRAARSPFYTRGDAPDDELTWEHLGEHFGALVDWEYRMINDPLLYDLVGFCRTWGPELVIWESTTVAGAIAAEACGAAHGRMTWALDFKGRYRERYVELKEQRPGDDRPDAMQEWITRQAARFGVGFSEELTTGQFTVDQLPESFRLNTDRPVLPMRYVPYNGSAELPDWILAPSDRPRVCLTLGATFKDRVGAPLADAQELIESLGEVDAEVVATFGKEQRAGLLGTVPDNVRLVDFVPFNALFPTCAAVVHHGGIGVFSTAMLAGVPQVILPEVYDTPARARRLERKGAGLVVEEGPEGLAARVRDALGTVLSEPAFAEGAAVLREEARTMPLPSEVVPWLEQHTARHRAGTAGAVVPV
ncbi:activator-dependent family glycosyltransferase [Nocardiopsis sp. NPDC058631]|uniref:activator-dependent family glycosyltransferase n=1 Tax=Nocardiopsis sp. NPDC058631 TaxID=3346566 RepID=UPI0036474C24